MLLGLNPALIGLYMSMLSTRLYQCLRCNRQVMVCQTCDHGQRYCAETCRQLARKASCKRANAKYQNSRAGRFNNADRQRRFRQRQKQNIEKVTDQGSPSTPRGDLLIETLCLNKNTVREKQIHTISTCHFCGDRCGPFFRGGFLKKRTTYAYQQKNNDRKELNGH
ncbi:MAG: hypothetical protein KC517_12400 [Bacteroidetes bacterium]|nr:hypothetical protein [Bacteroidota bacterium]